MGAIYRYGFTFDRKPTALTQAYYWRGVEFMIFLDARFAGLSHVRAVCIRIQIMGIDVKRHYAYRFKTGWIYDGHIICGLHGNPTNITARTCAQIGRSVKKSGSQTGISCRL